MAKGKGGGNPTTQADKDTMQLQREMYGAARNAARQPMAGLSQGTTQAQQAMRGFSSAGNLGLAGMSGDPAAMQQLMNPYEQQVIGGMHDAYGRIRANTLNSVDDAATGAGAFGGSRHGIASGVALGNIAQQEAQQIGQLMHAGYGNAQNQAMQLANLGFGGTQAMHQLGAYERDVTNENKMHEYNTLRGAIMPLGQEQSVQEGSRAAKALGGAATGMAFGPFGAAAGGLAGLLGWL